MNWNTANAPLDYFSTAAGPSMADLVGPNPGLLNVYGNGEQIAAAETSLSNGTGGGAAAWYQRADVHALILMLIGGYMIHEYLKES